MTKVCSKAVRFAAVLMGTTVIFGCDLLWYDIDKVLDKSLMDKKEEQAKPTSQPALFYMDADFQPTDRDSGITALAFVDAAVQGPMFASSDNEDGELVYITKVMPDGEVGTLVFGFPKGGGKTSFPESMGLKIGDGALQVSKVQYDANKDSFSVYMPDSTTSFKSYGFPKTAFDMYRDDPRLTESQNLRMRNMQVVMEMVSAIEAQPRNSLSRDLRGDWDRAMLEIAIGTAEVAMACFFTASSFGASTMITLPVALYGLEKLSKGVIALREVERAMAAAEAEKNKNEQTSGGSGTGGSSSGNGSSGGSSGGNSPDTADREPDRGGGSSGGNQSSGGNNSTGSSTDNSNTGSSNTGDNNTNTGGSSGGNSPDPAPAPEPDRGGGSGGGKQPDGGSDKGDNTPPSRPGGPSEIHTEMRSSPRT